MIDRGEGRGHVLAVARPHEAVGPGRVLHVEIQFSILEPDALGNDDHFSGFDLRGQISTQEREGFRRGLDSYDQAGSQVEGVLGVNADVGSAIQHNVSSLDAMPADFVDSATLFCHHGGQRTGVLAVDPEIAKRGAAEIQIAFLGDYMNGRLDVGRDCIHPRLLVADHVAQAALLVFCRPQAVDAEYPEQRFGRARSRDHEQQRCIHEKHQRYESLDDDFHGEEHMRGSLLTVDATIAVRMMKRSL